MMLLLLAACALAVDDVPPPLLPLTRSIHWDDMNRLCYTVGLSTPDAKALFQAEYPHCRVFENDDFFFVTTTHVVDVDEPLREMEIVVEFKELANHRTQVCFQDQEYNMVNGANQLGHSFQNKVVEIIAWRQLISRLAMTHSKLRNILQRSLF